MTPLGDMRISPNLSLDQLNASIFRHVNILHFLLIKAVTCRIDVVSNNQLQFAYMSQELDFR